MPLLPQDLVHKVVAGGAARVLRVALLILGVLALAVAYNWRSFKNFSVPEAMDQAQLARNLANGEGYTTRAIRPFSIFLLKRHNQERFDALTEEQRADLGHLKGAHPDIANPPAYPLLLAGWMKVYPALLTAADAVRPALPGFVKRIIPEGKASLELAAWDGGWHPHDFLIGLLNQALLLFAVFLTFRLARRLFDAPVAWTSAGLLLGAEILWRFSVSGLSTVLLLVLLLGVAHLLVRFDAAAGDAAAPMRRPLLLAAALGLLIGLGFLTRYSFAFVLAPVLGFVLLTGGTRRVPAAAAVLAVFALVAVPWLVRNAALCGAPLGTASYTVLENSLFFPGHALERSLNPDFTKVGVPPLWWKFFLGLRQTVLNDLPRLGGTWITGFFVVGLLIAFVSPAIRRFRYWTLGLLATLLLAQAFIRTATADELGEVQPENLLVLALPFVLMFGVALFYMLLEQVALPFLAARYMVIGAFCAVMVLPLAATFLPPRPPSTSFPPYDVTSIRLVSGWMGEQELTMTDVPWAVAWYGRRPAVWLTLDAENEFYALNDYLRPVKALYLTPQMLDARFLSQWVRPGGDRSWGTLVISALTNERLPPRFPLSKSTRMPEQLFLSDWERWSRPETPVPVR